MVPFTFDDEFIEALRATLPELPDARKERFVSGYGLPQPAATVLSGDLDLGAAFE